MADDGYTVNLDTNRVLVVGGDAEGELKNSGDRDWFKIYLTAGTSYYFTLAGSADGSGTLRDPHIYLYDSAGQAVTDNDDSGGSLNSRLVYTAPVSGYYYLAAGSYNDAQSGTYRLAAGSYETEYSSRTPGTLTDGGSLTGELQVVGDVDWVKVELTAGTVYTISLRGVDSGQGTLADPYLYLYDSEGKIIARDDDGSGRRDSVLTYTPASSGTFYLGLGAYQNASSGTYTLGMSSQTPTDDFTAGTDTSGQLSVGGSVGGKLEKNGDRDWFAVHLEAGEIYYFDLKGTAFVNGGLADSYLYLYDSAGNPVAFDDDGGQGLDSRIVFTAGASGTYYLAAAGFDDRQTGDYSLSAGKLPDSQHAGSGHITAYGVHEGDLTGGEHEWIAVALEAATTYLIALDDVGGTGDLLDPTLELRDGNGGAVANSREELGDKLRTITFTTDADGLYYIDIGSKGENDAGNYLLSIVGRQTEEFNLGSYNGSCSAINLFENYSNTPGWSAGLASAPEGSGGGQGGGAWTTSTQDNSSAGVAAKS